jgi:phosphoesterase RecJ-like protein
MAIKDNFLDEKRADIVQILNLIERNDNIVVLTHKNPDGDAIGSAYGIIDYCKSKGKTVTGFIPFSFPSNLKFINYGNVIRPFDEKQHKEIVRNAGLIIIVDLNSAGRVGDIEPYVRENNMPKILIDHHLEPEDFCDFYYVYPEAASAGQLVYEIISGDNNYRLSREAAQAIYTAIMTDTGSFRFPQTNANVHRIVVELLESGADPVKAYDNVYNSFPISAMRLKGRVYEKIETYKNDCVCISTITRRDYEETGAIEEQTEGIVESLLAVDTVKIAVLLMEEENNEIRCSFRAKDRYNVRHLAVNFKGGGHSQAAGARVKDKTIDELKKEIIEYIENNGFEE